MTARASPRRKPAQAARGEQAVDRRDDSLAFKHRQIVKGVESQRVKRLIENGTLAAKDVYRVIPERTFNRRVASDQPLTVPEADAVGRLLRIQEAARKTFGDDGFARKWLNAANPVLQNRIPIEMAETDAGAREVEMILTRIAYGVYS